MAVKLAVLFLSLSFALTAQTAERYRRNVEFEWEAIEGAAQYDLEIQKDKKPLRFNTKNAIWVGNLTPGNYKIKIRAKDQRGVPADWSPPVDFIVALETPHLLSPASEKEILSKAEEKTELHFSWDVVKGADTYSFELSSEDGTFEKKEELKKTEISLKLSVAKKYNWKVNATGMGMQSEQPALGQFSLLGEKIKTPTLEKPESEFVREVKWQAVPFAQSYTYNLSRLDPKTKTWKLVEKKEGKLETEMILPAEMPGGLYRLQTSAQGTLRVPSSTTQLDFKVRSGNRSPAAEEIATLRLSIDRLIGWYGIASYLLTVVDYKGVNFDRSNSNLNYSAIGGTGRLGAGYLSAKSPWGFLGIIDLGGITVVNASNYTYASIEGNGIYRSQLGLRGELRQQFGLFYKELPETYGRNSNSITSMQLVKSLGPHYGIEYWLAMTSKWGFQLNAHLYPSLVKVSTPNGQDIQPSLSNQVGVLASYRLQKNLTGLAGYAFRQDQMIYQAQPGRGSAGNNDFNQVQLSGHYLNLFLEWAL